jgi:hypothetical protein
MPVDYAELETLVEARGAPGNEYAVADRFADYPVRPRAVYLII